MLLYAATIFLSAFLLFLVQPLLAKQILPVVRRDGRRVDARAWCSSSSCCCWATPTRTGSRRASRAPQQAWVHIALLVASLVFLPMVPDAAWKPAGDENPVVAHPAAALRDRRPALLPALLDEPAAAGVVRARASRARAPTGCSRCRTSPRCWRCWATRSSSSRAFDNPRAVALVVGGLRGVRGALRGARLAEPRRCRALTVERRPDRGRPPTSRAPRARPDRALAHALGDGLGHAARASPTTSRRTSRRSRCCGWSRSRSTCSPSSSASRAATGTSATPTSGFLVWILCVMAWFLADKSLQFELLWHIAVFTVGPLLRLHVLPRRARAPPPGPAAPHALLPRGVAGRRDRRRAGGHRGAGDAARLPRARDRARGDRGAPRARAEPRAGRCRSWRCSRWWPRSPSAPSSIACTHFTAGHGAHRAQLLRRAAREGEPVARATTPTRATARSCTARSCTASSGCREKFRRSATTYYKPGSGIGHGDPRPRGPADQGRRDRPGHGHARGLRRRRRRLPLLRHQPGGRAHRATSTSPTSRTRPAKIEVVLGDARLSLEREAAAGLRRARGGRLLRRLDPGAPHHRTRRSARSCAT